jgi:hypothetical protein
MFYVLGMNREHSYSWSDLITLVTVVVVFVAAVRWLGRDLRPPVPEVFKAHSTLPPTPLLWVPIIGKIDGAANT